MFPLVGAEQWCGEWDVRLGEDVPEDLRHNALEFARMSRAFHRLLDEHKALAAAYNALVYAAAASEDD